MPPPRQGTRIFLRFENTCELARARSWLTDEELTRSKPSGTKSEEKSPTPSSSLPATLTAAAPNQPTKFLQKRGQKPGSQVVLQSDQGPTKNFLLSNRPVRFGIVLWSLLDLRTSSSLAQRPRPYRGKDLTRTGARLNSLYQSHLRCS